ncbi:MAG: penicillin-binding protein 2 [Betaproteobacteria bacterium]|nr:penicillin-binding protein 2 [Betaproteobacteria bacterium]
MALGELHNEERELQHFQLRIAFAGVVVLIAFGLLVTRFGYLQIVQHTYYKTRAEDNRISVVPVQPSRGLVQDRNGVVLARNFAAYTLEITPKLVPDVDATITELASIVNIEQRDRRRFKRLSDESRGSDSIPIRTKLSDEEVARFAANKFRFPGVDIRARLFREYPLGLVASHVIGYIGRISGKDLEKLGEGSKLAEYRGADHIGRTGLEAAYETELRGTVGSAQVEIDAGGRAVRTLESTPAVAGNNLILTLDIRLQEIAERAFGDFRGALVAIEPDTGGVLAFVSKPGFDPNLFIDGIDPQNWEALNNSPDRPLNNRALAGTYPPGSTFKPFMAVAGLQLGKRTPEFSIADSGSFGLPGVNHRWRDWKLSGHGTVNLHRSIVISCDTYYYGLGNDLGIDSIHNFIGRFGFGQLTGIDVPGEKPGLLPSQAWKQARYNQKWYAGDTISVSIGQGYNLATPLQLAQATAILANNGVVYKPHLVRHVQDPNTGTSRAIEPAPERTVALDPRWVELVKKAMVDVTKPGGTAAAAGLNAGYLWGGKTGTAQVVAIKQGEKYDEARVAERHRDHALFVAFAPADKPRIALAILVENGGHGSSTAAPIARTVVDYFLLGKVPANMPDLNPDAGDGD